MKRAWIFAAAALGAVGCDKLGGGPAPVPADEDLTIVV